MMNLKWIATGTACLCLFASQESNAQSYPAPLTTNAAFCGTTCGPTGCYASNCGTCTNRATNYWHRNMYRKPGAYFQPLTYPFRTMSSGWNGLWNPPVHNGAIYQPYGTPTYGPLYSPAYPTAPYPANGNPLFAPNVEADPDITTTPVISSNDNLNSSPFYP